MSTDLNYKKLTRQPITLVLAEFRFSEVLKIGNFIPDIQESLRKKYPRFTPKNEQSIEVHNDSVRVAGIASWIFGSADRKKAIYLDQNRLVFFSTEYDRFPAFQEESLAPLELVQKIVDPNLLLGIGLRYNDSVVPEPGELLEQYIEPPWIPPEPLLKLSKDRLAYHREETHVVTDIGALSVRTMIGKTNLRVMPDLVAGAHVSIDNNAPTDRLVAILDFDHSWNAGNESFGFSTEQARDTLGNLHAITREAFWEITTPFARDEKWT